AGGAKAPVHVVIASVDLASPVGLDRRLRPTGPVRHAVGLEEHPPARREAPSKDLEQSQWAVDPVQDSEADDEVELLLEPIEAEGVETAVLNVRVEQLRNRGEALTTLELNTPSRFDPHPVLLVVDGDDALCATRLGQECIEAVEGADVQHAHAAEVLRKGGDPVAMVASDA